MNKKMTENEIAESLFDEMARTNNIRKLDMNMLRLISYTYPKHDCDLICDLLAEMIYEFISEQVKGEIELDIAAEVSDKLCRALDAIDVREMIFDSIMDTTNDIALNDIDYKCLGAVLETNIERLYTRELEIKLALIEYFSKTMIK